MTNYSEHSQWNYNPCWAMPNLAGSLCGHPLCYQSEEKREVIYADTSCTRAAGSLNPGERCYCLGIIRGLALLLYRIDENGEWKTGFARHPERIHAVPFGGFISWEP